MAELNCIASLIRSANLKGYYRFLDVPTIGVDFSPNGKHLTNNNSVGVAAGVFGNAADFGNPNTNKSLTIADNLGIDGSAFSMVYRLKLNAFPTSGNTINPVHQVSIGTKTEFMVKFYNNGGTKSIGFFRTRTGVDQAGLGYLSYDPGTNWHQYALTYDGSNLKGYIDGSLQGTATSITGVGSATLGNFLGIGSGYYGDRTSGLIDDVGIFNTALSGGQITALYSGACDIKPSCFIPIL